MSPVDRLNAMRGYALASPPGAARIGTSRRSLLRAWNMRVLTALMGQSMMAAISAHE
jgi:hypothetical protein